MPATGFFIDANLFVLLVVGDVEQDLIPKHRRLRAFTVEDYKTLRNLIGRVNRVFVTPNTLTETSNLLAYHRGEPERSRFFDRLQFIIQESEEIVVASASASRNSAFRRLGLTDAALLEVVTAETPLITVDFDLYRAALEQGQGTTAYNFTHYRRL